MHIKFSRVRSISLSRRDVVESRGYARDKKNRGQLTGATRLRVGAPVPPGQTLPAAADLVFDIVKIITKNYVIINM